MNEKIQKLAEEAGLDVRTMGFENNQYQHDPWNIRLDKFVMLIVKECAGVAEVSMPITSHPDDRLIVKNSVLKQFGLE
jgi:hypothetical protein